MPETNAFLIYLYVFTAGLVAGLIFALIAWNGGRIARKELDKYKRLLGEKMELEASAIAKLKVELEELRKQNENLRIKVAELNQSSEKRLQRDLEIFARAEKRMIERSPGFPAAWEGAKKEAHEELVAEESGRTLPKRLFQKFSALTGGAKPIEGGEI